MSNPSLAGPPAGPTTAPAAVPPPSGTPAASRGPHGPAVASLVDSVLRPARGDQLVVVFTPSFKQAAVHVTAAARGCGAEARLTTAPGGDAAAAGGRIRSALRELGPVRPTAAGGGRRIVLFLGGAPVDLARLGLDPDLSAVHLGEPDDAPEAGPPGRPDLDGRAGRLAVLHARLLSAGAPRLVSGDGSELLIGWEPARPPVLDGGAPTPGELFQLPPGRIEIHVARADGVFLADADLHVNRPVRLGGPLRDRPVRLELTAGRVTGLDCPDPHTEAFLRRAVTVHQVNRLRLARCRPLADGRAEVRLSVAADDVVPSSGPAADLRFVLGARAVLVPAVAAAPCEPERI